MRIALVNSVARNTAGYHTMQVTFPCLGLQVLADRTPKQHDVMLFDEVLGPTNLQKHLQDGAIDLLGLSCYTSGATRAYEIAAQAKEYGVPTVMGGVHASSCPDEASQFVDSIAVGECDEIWPQIVHDAENKKLKPMYQGGIVDLTNTGRGAQDLTPMNGSYTLSCIQTSRGCPVGCKYCSVTKFNGAPIRRRDPMSIISEWNTVPRSSRVLFVVDDNFFGVSKKDADWAKAFCKLLIKKGKRRRWFSQTTLNMGDDEEGLRLAYKAGCRMMLIGFESFNTKNLTQYKKGINNKNLSRYKELVDKFHQQGIGVIGAFIVGADEDDMDTPLVTRQLANEIGVDVVQLTNLTPLPGTVMFDEFRDSGRLVTSDYPTDWERHTFTETIFKPTKMTRYELDYQLYRIRATAFRGKQSVWRKALRTLWRTKSIETALIARGMNANYRRIARYFAERDRERFRIPPQEGGNYPEDVVEEANAIAGVE